jgi:ABC-2 type transport system ATP-binding protein
VVQQDVGFPTTLRAGEAVIGAATRLGRDTAAARAALAEAGLEGQARQRAARLSGGQQRRLQLAMALVSDPQLLVLDEPTEGLDVAARRRFWTMLSARRDAGAGVLLTTHAVAEAAEVADRVVVVDAGRLVAEGTPDELTARVAQRRIRARTSVPPGTIGGWPGVESVTVHGEVIEVVAEPVEPVVHRLLDADPTLSDLTVTAASLADALVALDTTTEDVA